MLLVQYRLHYSQVCIEVDSFVLAHKKQRKDSQKQHGRDSGRKHQHNILFERRTFVYKISQRGQGYQRQADSRESFEADEKRMAL